jgi:hypothetical protein
VNEIAFDKYAVKSAYHWTECCGPLHRLKAGEWSPDEFRQFCRAELGVPVELKLPHPIALAEMYASDARLLGRSARLVMNGLTKLGHNPFTRGVGFRAYSTQTAIARKPS